MPRSYRLFAFGTICTLLMLVGLQLMPAHARADQPGAAGPASAGPVAPVAGLSAAQFRDGRVERHGSTLSLQGKPFRFAGANIEWLGLKNYGPEPSASIPAGSEAYPSEYEVDDAFATARDMGATVVRSQTLGDTIGCPDCIEPALGKFNPNAFAQMDKVVAAARRHGLKLLGEFDGDANARPAFPGARNVSSHSWYCQWRNRSDCGQAFFTDPRIISDYINHMRTVLEHVNPLTGLAYKDDPTFVGWVDGNNLALLDGVGLPAVEGWLGQVSKAFHTTSPRQLFVNISLGGGDAFVTPAALNIPGIDIYALEYYPHWFPLVSGGNRIDGAAPFLHQEAAQVAAAGKAFAVIEFGWDRTDFATPAALSDFLAGLRADPHIVGDNYWALLSHADGGGWQPVPANSRCNPTCEWGEDGNWWALYYTGRNTITNSAPDMAARAQLLRTHAFAVAGYRPPPPHQRVPAPRIISTADGHVRFEGSAGSPRYTIERRDAGGTWHTVCAHCVTDDDNGWIDPAPGVLACYRVIGVNLDGVPGPASAPAGPGCRRP
ncbi:hypothetical protein ACLQ3C_00965 [Gordonia sp. DT30]|uniref:hypothetical protein n=1 Tax=unclassified Gordonia (in: high G+C Gram-positive bacteria) TaxID=2657482 RepID=UPI003CFA7CF8